MTVLDLDHYRRDGTTGLYTPGSEARAEVVPNPPEQPEPAEDVDDALEVVDEIDGDGDVVALDLGLRKSPDLPPGAQGEEWQVHGGGFYHPTKYLGAPPALPQHLHWFYWESYSTWLSGFALFTALYLFNAGTFLIDRQVNDWSPMAASTGMTPFSFCSPSRGPTS